MANRAMEAKRLKLKKMRRNLPRKLQADYIPTGAPPNRIVMSEYRMRTKSLAFDPTYLAYLEEKAPFKNVPPGKMDIRKELEKMQARGYSDKVGYAILSNTIQRVMIYRNDDHTLFRICHENFRKKEVRWSIEYKSKEIATSRWNTGRVVWVSIKESSPSG